MYNKRFYAPILKWKTGEKTALQNLSQNHKNRIIPILEFIDRLEPPGVINDLNNCFEHPVGIDTLYIDEGDRHYLTSLLKEAINNGKTIYPILYFEDFPDVANDLCNLSNTIIVRLPVPEDINGPDHEAIFDYLNKWQQDKTVNLDILLDLNIIKSSREANLLYAITKNIIEKNILNNQAWQQVIIAVSSFPEELSSIAAGESTLFERIDIKFFEKLYQDKALSTIQDRLVFSDYGISKFTDMELDFSKLRYPILPKAKYTTSRHYWVLKGARNHLTKTWIKNHRSIALEICESPFYYGKNFSFGDLEIEERAHGLNGKGPGNNTNWVAICANHHIAVVIEELSSFGF